MREATLSELLTRIGYFFDVVESGETVRVFRNGRPIAEIRPVARDVMPWRKRPARPLSVKGVSISRFVLEDREE